MAIFKVTKKLYSNYSLSFQMTKKTSRVMKFLLCQMFNYPKYKLRHWTQEPSVLAIWKKSLLSNKLRSTTSKKKMRWNPKIIKQRLKNYRLLFSNTIIKSHIYKRNSKFRKDSLKRSSKKLKAKWLNWNSWNRSWRIK